MKLYKLSRAFSVNNMIRKNIYKHFSSDQYLSVIAITY